MFSPFVVQKIKSFAAQKVILEIISSIRRLERQSHRGSQRESSIELGLFDGSLGARVSGQSPGFLWANGFQTWNQQIGHREILIWERGRVKSGGLECFLLLTILAMQDNAGQL